MIPTPKDRFLADAALCKQHSDMVASTHFLVAMEAAMLEYAAQCARGKDPSKAGLLIQGAHGFVSIFSELSQPRTKPVTVDRDNL